MNPESSTSAAFAVTGDLTVAVAASLHQQMRPLLQAGGVAQVDLSGVTRADVFGLQLLCTLRRSAVAGNRPLRIANASPAILEVAASAGIKPAEFLSCP